MGALDKFLNRPKGNVVLLSVYGKKLDQMKQELERLQYHVTTVLVMAPEFDALRGEEGRPLVGLLHDVWEGANTPEDPSIADKAAVTAPVVAAPPATKLLPAVTAPSAVELLPADATTIQKLMAHLEAATAATEPAAPAAVPVAPPAPAPSAAPESLTKTLIRAARAAHANKGGAGFPRAHYTEKVDFIVTNPAQISKLLREVMPAPDLILADKEMPRAHDLHGVSIMELAKPILPDIAKLVLDGQYNARGIQDYYHRTGVDHHLDRNITHQQMDKRQLQAAAMDAKASHTYATSVTEAEAIFAAAKKMPKATTAYTDRVAATAGNWVRS